MPVNLDVHYVSDNGRGKRLMLVRRFTGRAGKQVPVAETVRAFKEILEGKHDEVAEGNFYMKGKIEEIYEAQ